RGETVWLPLSPWWERGSGGEGMRRRTALGCGRRRGTMHPRPSARSLGRVRTMPAFRRVKDVDAGPGALGLLTPPGRRTAFIVRRGALPWDLVAAAGQSPTGLPFRDFDRAEAAAAGAVLYRALEEWAVGGPGRVEVLDAATGGDYLVRVQVGALTLVACLRQ